MRELRDPGPVRRVVPPSWIQTWQSERIIRVQTVFHQTLSGPKRDQTRSRLLTLLWSWRQRNAGRPRAFYHSDKCADVTQGSELTGSHGRRGRAASYTLVHPPEPLLPACEGPVFAASGCPCSPIEGTEARVAVVRFGDKDGWRQADGNEGETLHLPYVQAAFRSDEVSDFDFGHEERV